MRYLCGMYVRWIRATTMLSTALLSMSVLPGCSWVPVSPAPVTPVAVESDEVTPADDVTTDSASVCSNAQQNCWWRVSVHIAWVDEDQEQESEEHIRWHIDSLLAQQVFEPILRQYRGKLSLWRFHRRAARDNAGHRFSFLFYAQSDTAAAVYGIINQHSLLQELQRQNIVIGVHNDDVNKNKRVNIEDTSDKNWSIEIQKTWPYFIMGVSEAWLRLIAEYAQQDASDNGEPATTELISLYKNIEERVRDTWKHEGGHAYLHHLSGVFGYDELYVYQRALTRF